MCDVESKLLTSSIDREGDKAIEEEEEGDSDGVGEGLGGDG